jgi:hypothetical protein
MENFKISNLEKMKQFRKTDYYVTEDGKVFSKKFNKMRELKPFLHRNGYLGVVLMINKKRIKYSVHRLVALTFISNPENKATVNHKDGIKINNHVSNLEWNTQSENIRHACDTGLCNSQGEKNNYSKLKEGDVRYIRNNYIPRHKEYGGAALGRKFNVGRSVISDIINKKSWTHILNY